MKSLRVAVVGAGHLGRIHTRLLGSIEQIELVGVVDPDAAARRRAAADFQVNAFTHYGEVADRIDAAIIATTTDQHHAVGTDLLSRGVHLFVEKPMTTTVAKADDLVALAESNGLVLQVGHVERFNPAWAAVARYLRRPRYIEASRTSGYTFRSIDIGVVLDLMIHDLDLVLSLVRGEVADLDAIGATIFGPHEDMAHARLRFANGCIANLNASRTSFQAQRTMQIVTDRAYAGIDFAAPSAKLVRPSKQVLRGEIDVQSLSADERERVRHNLFTDLLPVQDVPIESRNAILEEQREFVDCILSTRQPRVTGRQARACLAVAEQILEKIGPAHSADPTAKPLRQEALSSPPVIPAPHLSAGREQPAADQRKAG